MSKLTSRQNNVLLMQDKQIQDEINGCLWQPKNDINLIRYSWNKFEKFGTAVHLWGKTKSSEQKQLFWDQFWPTRPIDVTQELWLTKKLYVNCFLLSNVFISLRDLIFWQITPFCLSNPVTCAGTSATSLTCLSTDWLWHGWCNTKGFFRHSSIFLPVRLAIAGGCCR